MGIETKKQPLSFHGCVAFPHHALFYFHFSNAQCDELRKINKSADNVFVFNCSLIIYLIDAKRMEEAARITRSNKTGVVFLECY